MNILIYTTNNPQSMIGGIERISSRLASSLAQRGNNVYFLYSHKCECRLEDLKFKGELFIKEEEILSRQQEIISFINGKDIDVIIIQNVIANMLLLPILKEKTSSKIFYVLHNLPFFEKKWVNFQDHILPYVKDLISIKELPFRLQNLKRKILYKINWDKRVESDYRERYNYCDRFVLLSYSFQDLLLNTIRPRNKSKVSAIPNMLSYDSYLESTQLSNKEKTVLIVSRMDEPQKRISKALKIWRRIESVKEFNRWTLALVGDGPNLDDYRRYASKNLSRVVFYGNQRPKDYYIRSSIFLMTSEHEGWGITLTEAQQFGCVPIVLNTYSAAKDIITDEENGFLVNYEWQFVRRLKQLMRDSDMRNKMAINAIDSSRRFEKERVTDMWVDLFNSL